MSVAFVKEPNDSQVEVLPDREIGTDPNIVTARGMALIDREIARLEADLAKAQEGEEKITMANVNRDLRYWRARHATAELVAADPDAETVQFGSLVSIERNDGKAQTFRIVGIDEADPNDGLISYTAPLARSLIGKSAGDTVQAGPSEAEIVTISNAPAD